MKYAIFCVTFLLKMRWFSSTKNYKLPNNDRSRAVTSFSKLKWTRQFLRQHVTSNESFSNFLARCSRASLHCALTMNTIKSKLLSCYGIFLPCGQFVCDFKNVGSDYHIISCMYIQLTEHKRTQTWRSIAMSWRFVKLGLQNSGPSNTDVEFCAYSLLKH
jgi:hypothetical protein